MGNWKREDKKQRAELYVANYYKGKNAEVINKNYSDSEYATEGVICYYQWMDNMLRLQ